MNCYLFTDQGINLFILYHLDLDTVINCPKVVAYCIFIVRGAGGEEMYA